MGARAKRRERGRQKGDAHLLAAHPGYRILRPPTEFGCYAPFQLKAVVDFLNVIEGALESNDNKLLIDMRACTYVDAGASVLLFSQLERCRHKHGAAVLIRSPRNRLARFVLAVFGVSDNDEIFRPEALKKIEDKVMRVTSGVRGEPSPGEQTFKVASLADLLASETLADRLHAALNEAADNVLSWAYDHASQDASERWWIAGMLRPKQDAVFIALDRGVGIPATAPKNLGDALRGALDRLVAEGGYIKFPSSPLDWQVLLATIREKRTKSRLEERGKGLTSMIQLIDLFGGGRIEIVSGDARYRYERDGETPEGKEQCGPLGFRFPGTMVIWSIKPKRAEARS